jgi:hypothetical protein
LSDLKRGRSASSGDGGGGGDATRTQLETLLDGRVLYSHWADVPASVLTALGWEATDPAERRRIYEGPAETRGFREYGGDWLIVDDPHEPTCVVIGQDKDHKRLCASKLGRFLLVADETKEFNELHGHADDGTPSACLCFPSETKFSQRDLSKLTRLKRRFGMIMLSFDGFVPPSPPPPSDAAMDDGVVIQVTTAPFPREAPPLCRYHDNTRKAA